MQFWGCWHGPLWKNPLPKLPIRQNGSCLRNTDGGGVLLSGTEHFPSPLIGFWTWKEGLGACQFLITPMCDCHSDKQINIFALVPVMAEKSEITFECRWNKRLLISTGVICKLNSKLCVFLHFVRWQWIVWCANIDSTSVTREYFWWIKNHVFFLCDP